MPKVKEIALEFLKFKDKNRSDYICAFAIKLLEATKNTELSKNQNTELIKRVMIAVMTSQGRERLTGFIANTEKDIEYHLTSVLLKLQEQPFRFDQSKPQSNFIEAHTKRDINPNKLPEFITQDEEKYLKTLDPIYIDQNEPGRFSAAVQELLQKLNKKAGLEPNAKLERG
jgi:hypothetical protein